MNAEVQPLTSGVGPSSHSHGKGTLDVEDLSSLRDRDDNWVSSGWKSTLFPFSCTNLSRNLFYSSDWFVRFFFSLYTYDHGGYMDIITVRYIDTGSVVRSLLSFGRCCHRLLSVSGIIFFLPLPTQSSYSIFLLNHPLTPPMHSHKQNHTQSSNVQPFLRR